MKLEEGKTWREMLITLSAEQLDSSDAEAALADFDEAVNAGEYEVEDIFEEVCSSYDIEIEE